MPAIQAGLAARARTTREISSVNVRACGLLRTRRVEMIERWRCSAEICRSSRDARFMRRIVGREQQIGFGQVLDVNESVGRREPRLDAGAIGLDRAVGRECPGRRRQPRFARGLAGLGREDIRDRR